MSIATFPLYVLGALAFGAVFLVAFAPLWFLGREVADGLELVQGGFPRAIAEYFIPGGLSLSLAEKTLSKCLDAIDRVRQQNKS